MEDDCRQVRVQCSWSSSAHLGVCPAVAERAYVWCGLHWCRVVAYGTGSSQDRPLSLLVEVLPRSALCSFRATVVLPLWFEVCRLVGLRSVCLGVVGQGVVHLAVRLAAALVSSPCCSFLSFSTALVGLRVPMARMVCFVSRALRALTDGGRVSAVGVWLAVLLVEASVLRCGFSLWRVEEARCVCLLPLLSVGCLWW
ncbi:hypothetical protein Taro_056718 [Colocasia esculenta]|uniref:Uncharacterized protein n=1 Tax=Colocasia esculenta TaxID=4460 RepID=A0A843XXC5_COLES|nr:hypothetical protein [Colocasia esculenta]